MSKYDESKVLRSVGKVAKISEVSKVIEWGTEPHVGIKRLGMLDYLQHYCGYTVIFRRVPISPSVKTFVNTDAFTKRSKKAKVEEAPVKSKSKKK